MKVVLLVSLCGVLAASGAYADPEGAARGALFPVLAGGNLLVADLAMPLAAAIGEEPEEDVAVYTISEIGFGDDDCHDDD